MSEHTVVLYVRIPVEIKMFLDRLVGAAGPHSYPRVSIQSETTRILREAMLASKTPANDSPASRGALASKVTAAPSSPAPAAAKNGRRADRRRGGARIGDPGTWSRKLHAEIDQSVDEPLGSPQAWAADFENRPLGTPAPTAADFEKTKPGELLVIHWPGTADGKNQKTAKFVRLISPKGRPAGANRGVKVFVQVERVSAKGEPTGKFGDARAIELNDVLALGPFVRRIETPKNRCGNEQRIHRVVCSLEKGHVGRHKGENARGRCSWSATGAMWSPKTLAEQSQAGMQ